MAGIRTASIFEYCVRGANRGPCEHNGNYSGVQDVGPPAHPFVTEHGAEDELRVQHKD